MMPPGDNIIEIITGRDRGAGQQNNTSSSRYLIRQGSRSSSICAKSFSRVAKRDRGLTASRVRSMGRSGPNQEPAWNHNQTVNTKSDLKPVNLTAEPWGLTRRLHLGDVVTAIGVVFVRHRGDQNQGVKGILPAWRECTNAGLHPFFPPRTAPCCISPRTPSGPTARMGCRHYGRTIKKGASLPISAIAPKSFIWGKERNRGSGIDIHRQDTAPALHPLQLHQSWIAGQSSREKLLSAGLGNTLQADSLGFRNGL